MKVVHIITGLAMGGAEMSLYKLLKHMDRARFTSEVISLGGRGSIGDAIIELGVRVHCLGMRPGMVTPLAALQLSQLGHRLQPDLIQGWMYHGNLAALWMGAFKARTPVLWNIRAARTDLKNQKFATTGAIRLGAWLSSKPTVILNNSHASARDHEQVLGYRAGKQVVIPNGFDLDRFYPDREAYLAVRQELGLASDTPLVGLFGRYHPVKNHRMFLEAAASLLERGSSAHFLLAGRGVEIANSELAGWLEQLGVHERCHLLGERSDMTRLNAALDVGVSSSNSEGFPNVIGEAMASGVPCVVTDVGDSAWLVGETGHVIPSGDAQALAIGIAKLLDSEPQVLRKLGRSARQRIGELFSLDVTVEQYQSLYLQLAPESFEPSAKLACKPAGRSSQQDPKSIG